MPALGRKKPLTPGFNTSVTWRLALKMLERAPMNPPFLNDIAVAEQLGNCAERVARQQLQ